MIQSLGEMEAWSKVDSVERDGRPDKVLDPCFAAVGVDAQSCLQVDVRIAVAKTVGVKERDGDELEGRRGSDTDSVLGTYRPAGDASLGGDYTVGFGTEK